MPKVELRVQPVDLYKLLKFEGLAASGGEAKTLIAAGHVKLNGKVETRKRKKIVAGDVIEFDNQHYEILLQDAAADDRCTNEEKADDNSGTGDS